MGFLQVCVKTRTRQRLYRQRIVRTSPLTPRIGTTFVPGRSSDSPSFSSGAFPCDALHSGVMPDSSGLQQRGAVPECLSRQSTKAPASRFTPIHGYRAGHLKLAAILNANIRVCKMAYYLRVFSRTLPSEKLSAFFPGCGLEMVKAVPGVNAGFLPSLWQLLQ